MLENLGTGEGPGATLVDRGRGLAREGRGAFQVVGRAAPLEGGPLLGIRDTAQPLTDRVKDEVEISRVAGEPDEAIGPVEPDRSPRGSPIACTDGVLDGESRGRHQ